MKITSKLTVTTIDLQFTTTDVAEDIFYVYH